MLGDGETGVGDPGAFLSNVTPPAPDVSGSDIGLLIGVQAAQNNARQNVDPLTALESKAKASPGNVILFGGAALALAVLLIPSSPSGRRR